MRRELHKLKAEARKTGLKINVKKTKILRNRTEQIGQIKIWNVDIEEVRRVNYLGAVIEKNGRSKADVTNKDKQSTAGVQSTGRHMENKYSLQQTQSVWKVDKETTQKLQTFINKPLREILKIH
jgi:hypothetical protein